MTETLTGRQVLALLAQGEVPKIECSHDGSWWCSEDGDLWPYDPIMWRMKV